LNPGSGLLDELFLLGFLITFPIILQFIILFFPRLAISLSFGFDLSTFTRFDFEVLMFDFKSELLCVMYPMLDQLPEHDLSVDFKSIPPILLDLLLTRLKFFSSILVA
jgi:hypothetical protein